MSRILVLLAILILSGCSTKGQVTIVREGINIVNTSTGDWYGDVISRNSKTNLTYQNNSITSMNTGGYMLLAGDEGPASTNNNLDGAKFLGNKFVWNGVNGTSVITHGVFTGYNKDLLVKYNYLENTPYGIIFKSGTNEGQNMTFTSGGCAYNICKNGKFSVRLKGMNGLKIYNNTFYSGDNAGLYLVLITSNTDRTLPAPSLGTVLYNNIFYTTSKIPMIAIEQGSLSNFTCDYNVYWSTAGEPFFMVDGRTYSWAQWQAMGFDLHSKVIDPKFVNTTNFVPDTPLEYGKDLGTEWQNGLSVSAKWVVGSAPETAAQGAKWQVGAVLYKSTTSVSGITIIGSGGANSITTKNGTLQLIATILPENATDKSVTWTVVDGSSLATVSQSGLVTATAVGTGNVTVRATANDGSGIAGEITLSVSIPVTSSEITTGLADFKIYPIPNSGRFFTEFKTVPAKGILVEIFDVDGKLLHSKRIFDQKTEWNIDIFSSRVLLLKASSEVFAFTKKIVISR